CPEPGPAQAVVEAREQVLQRAPVPVRSGPHVPTGLRRDDQLVPMGAEVVPHDPPERLLRRAIRGAVVVREVEVGDASVERATEELAAVLERGVAAEVLPEPERDGRQLHTAAAAPPVRHPAVALGRGSVCHSHSSILTPPASEEKSPRSRICSAAVTKPATATHVSAPPTLTRCAPAATISSNVRFGRASTFTGFDRELQTARISSAVASPGA